MQVVEKTVSPRLLDNLLGSPQKRIQFLLIGLVGAILAVAACLLYPAKYKSEAAVLIESPAEGLATLGLSSFTDALQSAGFGSGGRENGYTYIEVLRNRTTLNSILDRVPKLARYFQPNGKPDTDSASRREVGVLRLRKAISMNYSTRDNLLRVSSQSHDPQVAVGVIRALLEELGAFNATIRSSRARVAAQFIRERCDEARAALAASEQRLSAFQASNLRIGNAPGLQLAQRRLEREVRSNEEVYALLSRQAEMANIEEKRNTPVFTVVDTPSVPAEPYRFPAAVAAIIGSLLAVSGTALVELWAFLWKGIRE